MRKGLLCLFVFLQLFANGQTITTIAGNGNASYAGDGGNPVTASIGFPGGIDFNTSGDFCFTEFNNTIRYVSPSAISTIAGNGVTGYSGDNGPAISAEMAGPSSVAFDAHGNLFISDYYNNKIRKIDFFSGIITTVAGNGVAAFSGDGGQATMASIYGPQGLDFDKDGNLYFSDYQNHRIRKIDQTGIISTIAGNGISIYNGDNVPAISAQIFANYGLHLDTAGNIYFADGYRVRKISANTGIITTVAGTGIGGNSSDGNIATISKIGQVYDVVADNFGNIYIADVDNDKIKMIDVYGIIHTIAGTNTSGYNGDEQPATAAQLKSPRGLAIDTCGNLYVCDNGNHRIRKVELNSDCLKLSTNYLSRNEAVSIYPNPAHTEINIAVDGAIEQVSITNLMGQALLRQQYAHTVNAVLDVSKLPTGIYVVKVNDTYVQRLLKE